MTRMLTFEGACDMTEEEAFSTPANESVEHKLRRWEYVLRVQMAEIDRLRANIDELKTENKRLVDWIQGDDREKEAMNKLRAAYPNTNAEALLALYRIMTDEEKYSTKRRLEACATLIEYKMDPEVAKVILDFLETIYKSEETDMTWKWDGQSYAKWDNTTGKFTDRAEVDTKDRMLALKLTQKLEARSAKQGNQKRRTNEKFALEIVRELGYKL